MATRGRAARALRLGALGPRDPRSGAKQPRAGLAVGGGRPRDQPLTTAQTRWAARGSAHGVFSVLLSTPVFVCLLFFIVFIFLLALFHLKD